MRTTELCSSTMMNDLPIENRSTTEREHHDGISINLCKSLIRTLLSAPPDKPFLRQTKTLNYTIRSVLLPQCRRRPCRQRSTAYLRLLLDCVQLIVNLHRTAFSLDSIAGPCSRKSASTFERIFIKLEGISRKDERKKPAFIYSLPAQHPRRFRSHLHKLLPRQVA